MVKPGGRKTRQIWTQHVYVPTSLYLTRGTRYKKLGIYDDEATHIIQICVLNIFNKYV